MEAPGRGKRLRPRPGATGRRRKENGTVSDITIGDFWGVEKIDAEISNDSGVSLILIHSEKGRQLFEAIKPNIQAKQVDYDASLAKNPSMYHSADRPPERDRFYADMQRLTWKRLVRKYLKDKPLAILRKKVIKPLLRKLHIR